MRLYAYICNPVDHAGQKTAVREAMPGTTSIRDTGDAYFP
jgi:hypothetical protein